MHDQNISIALNVSRARLTVIGFMLTIDIFVLGIFLSDVDQHLSLQILTEASLFFGLVSSLCIGTVAATLMLISERFDPVGNSDVSLFAFAEMTMFVSIVQTISGIFDGFVTLFDVNLGEAAIRTIGVTTGEVELTAAGAIFSQLVFYLFAVSWGFMTYVAPLWSVSRLPCSPQHKRNYIAYYFLFTALMFAMSAYALHIEFLVVGESPGLVQLFLQSFWAPSLWSDITGAI
jgi:hypothetical protein